MTLPADRDVVNRFAKVLRLRSRTRRAQDNKCRAPLRALHGFPSSRADEQREPCRGTGVYPERSRRAKRFTTTQAAACLLIFFASGCGINRLPTLDEQVKAAWSEVLNQYQRRADLIPNLVQTVKGYAKQEQQVLTQVTEARAKATSMQLPADVLSNPQAFHEFEQNQAALTGALGRLLVVSENYPQLKSDQNFLALQSQLEGTENRIAVARRDYILAVQEYNTALRTIPDRWIAAWFYPELKVRQTFTISQQAQEVPKVQF